jgi:hypothetical protein
MKSGYLLRSVWTLFFFLFSSIINLHAQITGDWTSKIAITIDHSFIDEELENWTLVFDQSFSPFLTQENGPLDADGLNPSLNTGADLRFSSDVNGLNELALDIRDWTTNNDPTRATCEVAVKIPFVDKDAPTTIYMWWGNGTASPYAPEDPFGQYNAYDDNHMVVFDGELTERKRGATVANEGTTDVAGKIGGARLFEQGPDETTGNHYRIPDAPYLDFASLTDEVTLEAIHKPTQTGAPRRIISRQSGNGTDPDTKYSTFAPYHLHILNGNFRFSVSDGNGTYSVNDQPTAVTPTPGEWYYQAAKYNYNGVSAVFDHFVNDASIREGSIQNDQEIPPGNQPLTIGCGYHDTDGVNYHYDGVIDEVRVSDSYRSDAWLKANYHNLFNSTGFISFQEIPGNSDIDTPFNIDAAIDGAVKGGAEFNLCLAGSTAEAATCWSGLGGDLWFEFTVPADSINSIRYTALTNTDDFEITAALFTKSPKVQLLCNNTAPNELNTQGLLEPGKTYLLGISSNTAACGEFQIEMFTNDLFAGATDITPLLERCSAEQQYTTAGASPDGTDQSCNTADKVANRWFKIDVPVSGNLLFEVKCNDPTLGDMRDPVLSLWNETGTTELFCAPYGTSGDVSTILAASGLSDPVVYLSVDVDDEDNVGTFTLCAYDDIIPNADLGVSNETICSSDQAEITISNTQAGVNYQLRLNSNDANVGSPQAGNGGDMVLVASPAVTTTYKVLATGGGERGVSVELKNLSTVTVNQTPVSAILYGMPNTPPDFGAQQSISSDVVMPRAVFAADLDGDGLQDALSASTGDRKIAWYKNEGNGTFGSQQVIDAPASSANGVYAADMDGNGTIDVLSSSGEEDSGEIAWYSNDGNASSFTKITIDALAIGALSVFAVDVDGDGDLDVLSSNQDDGILWYINDGDQTFTKAPVGSSLAVQSIFPADVDGDGQMDVLATVYQVGGGEPGPLDDPVAGVVWYKNQGNGSFSENLIAASDDATDVHAADVDADGDLDVFATHSPWNGPARVVWYENGSTPDWTEHEIFSAATPGIGAGPVRGADLDNDGDVDLVCGFFNRNMAWYQNSGDGNFTEQIIDNGEGDVISLHASDLDGDGDQDILSTQMIFGGSEEIAWHQNELLGPQCEGDIQFNEVGGAATSWTWTSSNPAVSFDPGNTDQNPLVSNIADGDEITVEVSNGTCTNSTSAIIPVNPLPNATYTLSEETICTGETATITQSGSEVGVDYQLRIEGSNVPVGNPITETGLAISFDVTPGSTTVYNVFATNATTSCEAELIDKSTVSLNELPEVTIAYGLPNPDPQFFEMEVANSVVNPYSSFAADIDNDGDMDVVNATEGSDDINWYENDGTGVFGSANLVSNSVDGPADIVVTDIDGDNNLDIISASRYDDKIAWYKNDGLGNFGAQQIISTSADGAYSVFVADMDGDGDQDVLSASYNDDKVAWYENKDGLGSYGPQQVISNIADGAISVYAADLDKDGDMDVISASKDDDKLAWYENDGAADPNFGSEIIISTSLDGAFNVIVADLNGDSRQDVVCAAWRGHKVVWFQNDGSASFPAGEQLITDVLSYPKYIFASDLDNDGDQDLLCASEGNEDISWFSNNGAGSFGSKTVIASSVSGALHVFAADLDNDGDKDVLSAGYYETSIQWYQSNLLKPACEGSAINFNEVAGDATSWTWSSSDPGDISYAPDHLSKSPTISGIEDGDIITVTVEDANTCTNSDNVIIDTDPAPDDSFSLSDETSCSGEMVEIIMSRSEVGISYQLRDDSNDSPVGATENGTGSPISFFVSPTSSIQYNILASNILSDCSSELIDKSIITVLPLPTGSFNLLSDVCSSTPAFDLNQGDPVGGIYTGKGITSSPEFDPAIAGAGKHILTYTYTGGNGCSDFARTTINVNEPKVQILHGTPNNPISFSETNIATTAAAPELSQTADLDGDGDQDMVYSIFSSDRIVWIENDGTGNFVGGEKLISTLADGPSSLFSADLDNDGDIDVMSASFLDKKIAWYENDGLGNFGVQQIISSSVNSANFVYASDLDSDGYLDVLSISLINDEIAWYKNDGSANFGTQRIISSTANGANCVYASDLDDDGDFDILSSSFNDDKIAWYENTDGMGTFGGEQIITTLADRASYVYSADLNNDGSMDVLSSSLDDNKIAWYENDGNGVFGVQQIISSNAIEAYMVRAADMDADGDMDVLSASYDDDKIAWYENDGTGNFVLENIVSSSANGANSVYASDLDNDGDLDLISSSDLDKKVNGYESNLLEAQCEGDIQFNEVGGAATSWTWSTDGSATIDDNTSQNPIISGLVNGETVSVAVSQGSCTNTTSATIGILPLPANGFTLSDHTITQGEIAIIDQDGSDIGVSYQLRVEGSNVPVGDPVDGKDAPIQFQVAPQSSVSYNVLATNTTTLCESVLTDIATVTVNNLPQVHITYGTPNTPIAFTEQSAISTSNRSFNIISADMNGDGHMDVIGSDFDGGRIDIFQNNGDGSFTSQTINSNAIGIWAIHVADVDSDGNNDVLAALSTSNKITWYRNNGDNTYDEFTITTNVAEPRSVYAIDMDYDGDMDVLSASRNDDKIAWYENDGNENFTQHDISTSAIQAWDVFAIDMDGDGDMDVLSASEGGIRIAWYKNKGDLSFEEIVVSNTTDQPNSVYAYDMDGDGLLDVLAASLSAGTLWYRNNGDETFQENLIGSGNPFLGNFRAIPFDMDLDGDTDVLSAGFGDEVFWFENTGGQVFVKQTVSTNVDAFVGVFASDLDWDGDLDLISASVDDSKITWFKNDLLTPQCPGGYIPFSETGGEAVGWRWTVDGPGTAIFNPNPNVQSPFIAGLMQGDTISVEVTTSNGSTATARVLAPLHELPQNDFELSDPTVCAGSIATIEQSGSEPTVVYQLRDDSDAPVGQPVTGTGSPIEFFATAMAATSYNVWATDTITGCSIQLTDLSMVSISGDDAPIGTFALSDPVLCPGEITATIKQDGSELNTTYQLRLNADNSPVGASVAGTGGPIEFKVGATKSALYNVLATSQVGDNCQVQLSDLSSVVVSPPINPDIVYGTPNRPPTFTDQLPLIDELDGTLYAVHGVDIDDDGDTDVLATDWGGSGQNNINLYRNDGTQAFVKSQVADADFNGLYDVLAVDMDDDGDKDIVGASAYDGVAWFENDGGFSSPVPAQIIDTDFSFSVFAIDLNLDGHMDVLSADFDGDKVSWFENDGAEGFTSHIIANSLENASDVFAADMDNDGDLDVLSTSRGSGVSGSVNLHRNDGSMGFTSETIDDFNMSGANSVFAADFDGDGDNDVVAATRDGSGVIKWYENDGLGNFVTHIIVQGYNGVQKLFATDMDSDGHIDIVGVNMNTDEVFWYQNDGNGNFTQYVTSTAWESPGAAFPVDVDSDGDMDIIGGVRNGVSKPLFWQRSNLLEAQCAGDIEFSEVGGSAVSWLWSSDNAAVTFDDNTGQNPVVSGLADGDKVEVEVTDINGCTQSTVATMPIKPRPVIVVTNVIDPDNCGDDGTINLTISNLDNGPYTFDYDGGSFTNVDVSNGVASIAAPAGVYNNLTVTPPNGCTSEGGVSAIIKDPGAPEITLVSSTNPARCGEDDGSIALSFNGVPLGTYTVNYLGGSFANVDVDALGNATIDAPAGEYQNLSITVGGCTSADDLDVLLEDPVLVVNAFSATDVLCAGGSSGSITITVSNGVSDYTFDLGGDATQSVTQAGNSYTFGSLPAGSYTVDVTVEGNNCAAPQQQATIVAPATAIQLVGISQNNATCAYDSDGAITVQVSGGTGDYSFTLAGDANESVTQASGQYTFENLGVGAYTVNVQDANSCAISQQAFEITSFPTPVSNYSLTGTSICVGEIATIAMGGSESTANYQLRLESNNTPVGPLVPGTGNPIDLTASPTFTTEYNVLAIDKFSGCEAELSNRVTVSVNELPAAIISYGTPNVPPSFTEQVAISTSAIEAWSVYSTDIDGDGHMDVLYASNDGKIAWYKNTDGAGTFGAEQTISTNVIVAFSVYAIDIDGDNDMDVLSASYRDNKIAWYENTDGAGTFGAQQEISTSAFGAASVFSADLDGDGDMDVLSASLTDDKIAWYENDGAGTFGAQQEISTSANGAISVFSADLDGDGDMDVLSASVLDDKIAWYENDGAGTFGAQQEISTSANGATSVFSADLDGDGDMDVLSASQSDDKIAWYENDGAGTFGAQQEISTSADGARSVFSADLDGDGDMDVLSASLNDDKITWYENDGAGTFGAQQVISTAALGAISVYATDIDGDGDMDVLSASVGDDKIAWYKNDLLQPQCDGDIQFNEVGGDAATWTWTSSNPAVSFAPGNTDQNPLVSNIAEGDEITVEVSNGTCTNTASATISVNPLPNSTYEVTGQAIESSDPSATINVSGSENDVRYQLRLESDNTPVGTPQEPGGGIFAFTVDPAPASTTAYNVLATNTVTGCEVQLVDTAIVTVDDEPLPIRLLSFYVRFVEQEHKVQVDWVTSIEINNDFFTVERSVNGTDWEVIATVDGAGNSSTELHYSIDDKDPYPGLSYYRLKQTDFDGLFTYSPVRTVEINSLGYSEITIYPNPTFSEITIQGSEDELAQIGIWNTVGQDVTTLTRQVGQSDSRRVIDLSNLSPGLYYIRTKTTVNKVQKQ